MKTQRGLKLSTALLLSLLIASITSSAESSFSGTVRGSTPRFKASASSLAAQRNKKVKLTIIVLGQDTKPVAGAQVDIAHDAFGPEFRAYDYRLETDANGVASTDVVIGNKWGEGSLYWPVVNIVATKDLQRGRGRVKFVGPNYRPEETSRIVMNPIDSTGADLVSVQVHVANLNGDPVDGARVIISGSSPSERYQGITGADGNTTIPVPVILKKTYGIEASKTGYNSTKTRIELSDKEFGKVVAAPAIKLSKVAGVEVTVSVKDQESQLGIGDAMVILDGPGYHSEKTDSAGNARLFVPEHGGFAVRISQQHYEPFEGEARILQGEEQKALPFTLKAKPKKADGPASIEVTVLQGDRVEKLAGYNLPLPDASVTVGQTTTSTDRSGRAYIAGDFEGSVEVVVEASGYKRQTKSVRLSDKQRFTGGTASATFLMYPESTEDSIEVSVFTAGKNNESSAPLAGATVTAGGETATTNASGRAKLTGDFADAVEVSVEKSGYLRQAKSISASGGKGSANFTLQPEPDEDSVSITVMAPDPKGGRPSPIAGAEVSVNGLTAKTDGGGQAIIKGNFSDGVEVNAQAEGFVGQAQQVTIAQPSRTGTANFLLQPKTSLRLIVEVRASAAPNNPLAEALVHVRPLGKAMGSTPLAVQGTNDRGEASIEIRGSAEELALIRSGLTLHVGKEKYKAKLSDIAAGQLPPSTEPLRWTVFLERDWADLRAAVDALEQRVSAWNNDLNAAGEAADLVRRLAEQGQQAKTRSAALLQELQSIGPTLLTQGISAAALQCREAARLKSNIQGYKLEADTKEQSLKTLLDNASALVARCSSASDGDAARTMYKNATQLARAINALERNAAGDSNDLNNLVREKNELERIIEEVEKKVAEIGQESANAEQAVATAGTQFIRADNLRKSLKGRHAALSGELASLKAQYGLDNLVDGLPPDLERRVEVMGQLLGNQNNNVFGGPDIDWTKTVQDVAAQVQKDKASAEQYLALYKGGTSGSCVVESMDDVVREIGAVNTSATIELGAGFVLNEKAEACIKKGVCQPILNNVPALLEQGAIDPAAEKINQARAQGCDVSGLDELLDYWKTLRDAVVYLKGLGQDCKFREGYEWSLNVPASIRNQPLMKDAMNEVYNGMKAQERIGALQRSAKAAVERTNKMASAEPFIQQAEQIAASFACLVNEASRFRSEYQVTGLIHKQPIIGAMGAPVDKPEVEEIPEDADEAGEIISNINKDDRKKPEVEEIPEETVVPTKPADRRPGQPEVEEIPEEVAERPKPPRRPRPAEPEKPAVEKVPQEVAEPTQPQPPKRAADVADISGTWRYSTDWVYSITQTGSTFTWSMGKFNEKGEGTISGSVISASWSGTNGSGSATGTVTRVDEAGRATRIEWNNGVVFTRN